MALGEVELQRRARRVHGQAVLDLEVIVALVDHVEGGARRVPERHRRQDDLGSIEGEPRVDRGRVEHQCEVRPLAALLAAADVHGHLGLGSGAGWRTATT